MGLFQSLDGKIKSVENKLHLLRSRLVELEAMERDSLVNKNREGAHRQRIRQTNYKIKILIQKLETLEQKKARKEGISEHATKLQESTAERRNKVAELARSKVVKSVKKKK